MKKLFYPLLLLTTAASTVCNAAENKPFTFYNIAPFAAGKEKRTANDMIEYQKITGNDIVLYNLTIHPEGFPARKKADKLIASYRQLKKELAGSKVKLGVLVQSIIGHWPRVDKDEEQWTRTINIEGKISRFCPLDPEYRKYITYVTTQIAREKPVFIMGDDDIRAFSPKAECFCVRHVAEFNKRTGKNYTSDTLREAVKKSRPGDEIFNTFLQLQRDTVNGVAALMRQAIDSVDPSIPAGSCMPGWEFRFNDQTARAFAGKGQTPVMRVCNSNYLELDSKRTFPYIVLRSQALRAAHPAINVLDEADTCPHNLYSRSSINMHAKLCTSIMAGMTGAKVWLVNAHKGDWEVPRNYTFTLGKYQHFYQELTRTVKDTALTGVIQPCHKNFPNWHFTAPSEFFVEFKNWADYMCGTFGIPFQCSFDLNKDGVYLLSGAAAVARFSDSELKQLLSRKLLVDGPAATALTKRGFAEYLGLTAEAKDFRFNRERYVDGRAVTMGKDPQVPFITLKDKNAEVLSYYYYSPFASSDELEKVSPATVFVKNSLGGYICTTGFHVNVSPHQIHNPSRKEWLLTVLDKLNGKRLPVTVANEQNFVAVTREDKAGDTILAVCNVNFEPVENLALRCAARPGSIKMLTADGKWQNIAFKWQNNTAILPHKMDCYTLSVFKVCNAQNLN